MKNAVKQLALGALVVGMAMSVWATEAMPGLGMTADQKKQLSYTLGFQMGSNFRTQSVDIDVSDLTAGLQDALTNKNPRLSKTEMEGTLVNFQKLWLERHRKTVEQLADTNQKAGDAFLAENKSKPDMVVDASGLQYQVRNTGEGASPQPTDMVTVEYIGKTINGKIFDQSKQPVTFRLKDLIPAWNIALAKMNRGAKWTVFAPAKLAYGAQGIPNGPIGPNEVLIFDIHLVDFKKGDEKADKSAALSKMVQDMDQAAKAQ